MGGGAEVAPLGGFGKQYQVNVDPNRLQAYGVSINKVVEAIRGEPLDAARFEPATATAHPNRQQEFRTDKGRVVTGGGGIQPDLVVYPPATNRLHTVLDASGSFTNFATEYPRDRKITAEFEVTPQIIDEFRVFLSDRSIQPGIS